MYITLGWAFYLINPWRPRIDEIIRRVLEAGMIEKWKERTWYRMKEEHRKVLQDNQEKAITFDIKPLIAALSMDDFQVRIKT